MQSLNFTEIAYDPKLLDSWKAGNYRWFRDSNAPESIRTVLIEKAARRQGTTPTRRFFGEAVVAAELGHKQGWYGSFKWVTARGYLEQTRSSDQPHQREYRRALHKYIGEDGIRELQHKAARLTKNADVKPVLPDLWFVDGKTLQFVEAKLRRDRLNDGQLAGFAVLACSGFLRVPAIITAGSPSEVARCHSSYGVVRLHTVPGLLAHVV